MRRLSRLPALLIQATCKKSLEQVALKVYHMENLCELNHYQVGVDGVWRGVDEDAGEVLG